MNLLVFFGLSSLLVSLNSLSTGEQLYHREGRFIDLAVHKYKTQLPSISDIANSFIHYRVPVAVFVPTVRLNIRSKQNRITYSSFPTSSASPKKTGQPAAIAQDAQNKLPISSSEQELQNKSNKDLAPPPPPITRSGWTARSLNNKKPNRSYYSISNQKLHRIGEATRRRNYASSSESNADLVPFLYKDNLPSYPNLLNAQLQLNSANPGHVFAQNIAYIQPNSVSPFQPNILLLPANQQAPVVEQLVNSSAPVNANSTRSAVQQSVAGQPSSPVSSSSPIEPLVNRPISESIVAMNGSSPDSSTVQFDVSQVGENPDEIAQEHVQNHEPLDAVPVNSVEDPARVNLSYSDPSSITDAAGANSIRNVSNDAISNLTTSPISSQPTISLGEESRQLEPIQNARLIEIPMLPYAYGSNFIRRLESNPVYDPVRMPKNLVTNRAHRSLHRSLPIDLPSMVGLYTAAAAQSGHTSENRRHLFARILDENYS